MNSINKKVQIPIISISTATDDGGDYDENSYSFLEATTDVEELGDTSTKKRVTNVSKLKKQKSKSIPRNRALTDVEDMSASEAEDNIPKSSKKYSPTVFSKISNIENEFFEEKCKVRSKVSKGKKKIHTESSTKYEKKSVAPIKYSAADANDTTVTDFEDFYASDQDVYEFEPIDIDISEFLNVSEEIKIADELRTTSPSRVSPSTTPIPRSPRRGSKGISNNFSAERFLTALQNNNPECLTDVEVLQETTIEKKHKKIHKRKQPSAKISTNNNYNENAENETSFAKNSNETLLNREGKKKYNLTVNKNSTGAIKRKSLPSINNYVPKVELDANENFLLIKSKSSSTTNLANAEKSKVFHETVTTDIEDFSEDEQVLQGEIGSKSKQSLHRKTQHLPLPYKTADPITDTEDLSSHTDNSDTVNMNKLQFNNQAHINNNYNYDTEELTDMSDFSSSEDEERSYFNKRENVNISLPNSPPHVQKTESNTYKEVSLFFCNPREQLASGSDSRTRNRLSSLLLTDNEDVFISADEEIICNRRKVFTPVDLHRMLDESIASKIHNQCKRNANFYSPSELLYLKYNAYQDAITDTEDLNISEDERGFKKKHSKRFRNGEKDKADVPQQQQEIVQIKDEKTGESLDHPQSSATVKQPDTTVKGDESKQTKEGKKDKQVKDQHKLSDEMEELLEAMKEVGKK